MKIIACKDLGFDCDFVAKGLFKLVAMQKMSSHVMQMHADKVAELQKTMSRDEMVKMMTSKIKDE